MNSNSNLDLQAEFNKGGYTDLDALANKSNKRKNWKIPSLVTALGLGASILLGGSSLSCSNNDYQEPPAHVETISEDSYNSVNTFFENFAELSDFAEDELPQIIADSAEYMAKGLNDLIPENRTETYTVQRGDNLTKIAENYVDRGLYQTLDVALADIISDNNITNPNLIYPGQILTIDTSDLSDYTNTNQINEVPFIESNSNPDNVWIDDGGNSRYAHIGRELNENRADLGCLVRDILDKSNPGWETQQELNDAINYFATQPVEEESTYQAESADTLVSSDTTSYLLIPRLDRDRIFNEVSESLASRLGHLDTNISKLETNIDSYSQIELDLAIDTVIAENESLSQDIEIYEQAIADTTITEDTWIVGWEDIPEIYPEIVDYDIQRVESPRIDYIQMFDLPNIELPEVESRVDSLRQARINDIDYIEELGLNPSEGLDTELLGDSELTSATETYITEVTQPSSVAPTDFTPNITTATAITEELTQSTYQSSGLPSLEDSVSYTPNVSSSQSDIQSPPTAGWNYSSLDESLPRIGYDTRTRNISIENFESGDYTLLLLGANGGLVAHRYIPELNGDLVEYIRRDLTRDCDFTISSEDFGSISLDSEEFRFLTPRDQGTYIEASWDQILRSVYEIRLVEGACPIGEEGTINTLDYMGSPVVHIR